MIVLSLLVFLPCKVSAATVKADTIAIFKKQRLMLLFSDGEIIKAYRVSLGKDPVGQKLREGDKKTPEGVYYIESRKSDSKFYKALKISYPNEQDRQRAERAGQSPGGLIMIHGLPKELQSLDRLHRRMDWTDGCIAVTNREIDEIWDMVPEGIPVFINP